MFLQLTWKVGKVRLFTHFADWRASAAIYVARKQHPAKKRECMFPSQTCLMWHKQQTKKGLLVFSVFDFFESFCFFVFTLAVFFFFGVFNSLFGIFAFELLLFWLFLTLFIFFGPLGLFVEFFWFFWTVLGLLGFLKLRGVWGGCVRFISRVSPSPGLVKLLALSN